MEWRHTIFHDQQLVFSSVPKVANTSIKVALQKAAFPLEQRAWVHSPDAPFETVTPAQIFNEYAHYFRFAFVRNPFDRVVSFFHNKIVKPDRVINPLLDTGFRKSMTFEETARQICAVDDAHADGHFRSQHQFLLWRGSLIPTFVGRFENLDDDWQVVRLSVRKRTKKTVLPELPHKVATDHEPFSSYYTPDLAALVAERYARDLQLFGYQFPQLRGVEIAEDTAVTPGVPTRGVPAREGAAPPSLLRRGRKAVAAARQTLRGPSRAGR